MRPGACLCQVKLGTALNHRQALFQVHAQRLFQGQQTRFAVHQGQQRDGKCRLERRALVELEQDRFDLNPGLQLNHNPHALAV